MEKKGFVSILIILLVLVNLSFIYAQTSDSIEQQKIDNAYQCVLDKITGNCASLSNEEKIFSLLSVNQCQTELKNSSYNNLECWSSGTGSCKLKTTAQAVLAFDYVNENTTKAQEWLLSQGRKTSELTWYLQVESPNPTTCIVTYDEMEYTISIGENKKINRNAGNCLTLTSDNYWFEVLPLCYGIEFRVSCDENFLTTLLFRKSDSSTIHVSDKSSSAAAHGTTIEEVNSMCFIEAGSCNYEGSLWAAIALNEIGQDISAYLPYLITFAEANQKFIPDAFLYILTRDSSYRVSLLSKQKTNQWWRENESPYYDTALALYPFQGETLTEKTNAKTWLLNVQGADGCWDSGNLRNTEFILTSIWPRNFITVPDDDSDNGDNGDDSDTGNGDTNQTSPGGGSTIFDCQETGYHCIPSGECPLSSLKSGYSCPVLSQCCAIPQTKQTCSDLYGDICTSNQRCAGGNTVSADDLKTGEVCCIGGTCELRTSQEPVLSACEISGGSCKAWGCDSNEEESSLSCNYGGEVCCFSETGSKKSLLWVWLFLILIVLVVLGIIFRDKLREFWFKMKSKFGKSGKGKPGHPPYGHRPRIGHPGPPLQHRPSPHPSRPMPHRRLPERKILLPGSQPQRPPQKPHPGRPPKSTAEKELDDVLKKLKDMSK